MVVINVARVSPSAYANVFSSFDFDSENWQVVSLANFSQNDYRVIGQYQPVFINGGGNPGHYLSATGPDGGDFTLPAPSAFRGAQTGAIGFS